MNTKFCCQILILIALLGLFATCNAAESEKDFAKCEKMLVKYADSTVEKAARAKQKHDKKIINRIAQHADDHADPSIEEVRMGGIINRLIAQYDLPQYQRVLIDEAAEEVLTLENDEEFRCPHRANANLAFKRNFERYEERLQKIENAVDERLELENIGPNEGLIVILFYSSGLAQNVQINRLGSIVGDIRFGPVENSEYFRVLKVKAGDYRWHSIWNQYWLGGRRTLFVKHSNLDFTVEAGKLNYTGVFMFNSNSWRRWTADVRDRTSVVLSLLESRYPELLSELEFSNAVNSDNRFIDFYFSEKKSVPTHPDDA